MMHTSSRQFSYVITDVLVDKSEVTPRITSTMSGITAGTGAKNVVYKADTNVAVIAAMYLTTRFPLNSTDTTR